MYYQKKNLRPQYLRGRLLFLVTILATLALVSLLTDTSLNQRTLFFSLLILTISVYLFSFALSIRAMSYLKEAEARMIGIEDKYWNVLNHTGEGIFITDEKGIIQETSKSFAEMLNYTQYFLIGKNIWDYLKAENLPTQNSFNDLKGSELESIGLRMQGIHKNGEKIPVEVRLFAIRKKKAFRGYRGFVKNISEKMYEEDKTQSILFSFYQTIRPKLEEFCLFSDSMPQEYQKSLNALREEITLRLNPKSISKLLPSVKKKPLDFNLIFQELKKYLEPLARIKEQILTFEIPENINVTCLGDSEKIFTALKNILLNALNFTHPGGTIKLNFTVTDRNIEITISDNGIGINEKDREFIFQPFYTTARDINYKKRGAGIGLWIANEFIKMHNGSIKAEPISDKGTLFTIILPRKSGFEASPYDSAIS